MDMLSRRLKLGGSTAAIIAATSFIANVAMAQDGGGDQSTSPPIETVVVTGTNIAGIAPVGSHVVSLDQNTINATAPINVQELIQTDTAISSANGPPQGQNAFSWYAPQIHQLAGSASNSTLVIVDGMRPPAGGTQGYSESDPGIIPTIAIQRVEILADGASSIYGSDAVAGVVNFITRTSYDGLQIQAQGGVGDHYSSDNFGLLWGNHWATGSAMFAGNYTFQSMVANNSRYIPSLGNFTSLGGNNNFETFGCPTAAVEVPGSSNLYLSPASTTSVANTIANHNCNTTVYGDILPQQIRQSMLLKLNQDFGDRLTTTLMVDGSILKTYANAAPGSVTNVTAYGSGATGAPLTNGQINPFFQAPAGAPTANQETVDWVDLMGNGPNGTNFGASTVEEDAFMTTFVANYKLTDTWNIKFSDALDWDRSNSSSINTFCATCAYLGINGTAVTTGSTTTSDISGANVIARNTPLTTANALDIWDAAGSSNKTSAAALHNLYNATTQTNDWNTMNDSKLEASGDLFAVPAGVVKLALGTEIASYHLINDGISADNTGNELLGLQDLIYRSARVVYSAYGELEVPIISPDMDIPLLRKVDFDVSGRYDKYSDVGTTANPKFAMNWEIIEGVKLRGNYSTSFVAPPMGVVGDPALGGTFRGGGATAVNGGINVPVSVYPTVTLLPGCGTATVQCTLPSSDQGICRQFGCGLDNCKPQTGDGWSVGLDFAPQFLPGFSSSITLFNNEFKGGVTQAIIGLITSTPALNSRLQIYPNGATQAQIDAFDRDPQGAIFQGTIPTTVLFSENTDESNVLYLSIQGIDLNGSYQFDTNWGNFTLGDGMTYFTKYTESGGPGTYAYSILNTDGLATTFAAIQMQNRAHLGWALDPIAVDAFWNFTGAYHYDGLTAVAPVLDNGPNGTFSGGGDHVNSNSTFDVHVAYNTPDGWFAGDQVYLDGKNIFDKRPPFVNAAGGYDSFESNPIGRVISLGLRANL